MSANFFQLYKGIGNGEINQEISCINNHIYSGHGFEMERRKVLDSLGYNVGYKGDQCLTKNKHHGKLARDKNKTKTRHFSKLDDQEIELAVWKKNYPFKLQEINKYQALANEMKFALLDKNVPDSLWRKFEDPHSYNQKIRRSHKNHILDSELPSLVYTPINDIENGRSVAPAKHRWTIMEIKKINDLYWKINRPQTKNPAAWDTYYQIFISRFLDTYPTHSVEKVKNKIEEMLSLKQLKMEGEEHYWKGLVKPLQSKQTSTDITTTKKLPPLLRSKSSLNIKIKEPSSSDTLRTTSKMNTSRTGYSSVTTTKIP
mmetsp:Transcript_7313/g.7400  ORF Transcript_7313/g.7400 Transcript_7313/m.7400 type:complete len:315 (-) Transcript_7313:404-1348(-)